MTVPFPRLSPAAGAKLGSLAADPNNPRWFRRSLLAAAVAIAFAAGCGGDDDTGSSEPPATLDPVAAKDLTGRTFESTEVEGHELVSGTTVTISFGPGALTASAGCNSIRGGYVIEDGELTLGKGAGTLIGCPEDRQAQDEWLTGLLSKGVEVTGRGSEIVLTNGEVTMRMEEGTVPGGPPPVIGTTWELNSFDDGTGDVTHVKQGVRLPFIRFADNRTMRIFDGCDEGKGLAEVNDDLTIDFAVIRSTLQECPGLTGEVSQVMLRVLKGETSYAFEGQNLVISRQGAFLTFTPG